MFKSRQFLARQFNARQFGGDGAPVVIVAQVGGGVNYNQARQAWIRREDEEFVILNGRLSQP